MCASRRDVFAGMKNCSPAICRAEKTSQSRYSPRRRPSPVLGHAPDNQSLRVDDLPVLEARRGIDAGHAVDERGRIDGLEQAGAFEVGGHDLRRFGARAGAGKFRNRDGDRAHLPAPDFNLDLRPPRRMRGKQSECDQQSAEKRLRNGRPPMLIGNSYQPPYMSRGLKRKIISRHCSYCCGGML